MKLKNGYYIEKENGMHKIMPLDKTITLSEIGAFLWECIREKDLNSNELLNLLLDNFEISTVLALGEIDIFIKCMKVNGILNDEKGK